jgi:curved DNA-binding protein CbpA
MIASHDDGEITYYDELGVAPNASAEEIRDAFRLFVRLLHPDQQTDPQLKEIAENQMRKLNRIHAVLSDPESRRRYDEVLDTDFSSPIILNALNSRSRGLRRFGATLAWIVAIVVSAGLLIWLASDNTPGVQSRAADPSLAPATNLSPAPAPPGKPAVNQESGAAQISQLRSDLRAAIVERDSAIQELNKLRGNAENRPRQVAQSGGIGPVEAGEPRPALTMTELPPASKLPVLANPAPPRVERPANRQLAGFWFYAKPQDGQTNKNQALYPPEFIEATITEEGGVIHGRYRSRFLIVDRAISPDVNFTFTGTPNGSQCNCQWTGAAGARGDLTLKLTSENSMRIDWTASEIGTLQGLSSGTAVLTRRIE